MWARMGSPETSMKMNRVFEERKGKKRGLLLYYVYDDTKYEDNRSTRTKFTLLAQKRLIWRIP